MCRKAGQTQTSGTTSCLATVPKHGTKKMEKMTEMNSMATLTPTGLDMTTGYIATCLMKRYQSSCWRKNAKTMNNWQVSS